MAYRPPDYPPEYGIDVGDCDNCGAADVELTAWNHADLCEDCHADAEGDAAIDAYEDRQLRRAEDGWRDA